MADVRLPQHIEKGNEDGLFISSVASCSNLWALIMDAGTGFNSQVYELSPYFLHKVCAQLNVGWCSIEDFKFSLLLLHKHQCLYALNFFF